MRTTCTLLAVCAAQLAIAQITIGPADMPSAGDTVRFQNTSAIGLDPAPTEAGFIWDFGMLAADGEGADTCVAVSSTPLLYQFYFNNPFLYPEWDADYAQRGQSFDFQGQLTVSDVYDYFKNDAAGFQNVGFGANVNGLPTSVRRIPVDIVHVFPLEFGDMDTSYSEFSLEVPTLFSFTQQQTRFNEVDGWGTLYLPADTFEVLRVKSTLVRFDSVYIEQFGQGFSFPEPESIEYKWIAQGMDEPVLLITTTAGQATAARFYYQLEDISTGIGSGSAERVFSVAPNPAQESVLFSLPEGAIGALELRDATGRLVRSQRIARSAASVRVDLGDLPDGVYTAMLVTLEGVWSTRVCVQR
jgi:hypothetical protein